MNSRRDLLRLVPVAVCAAAAVALFTISNRPAATASGEGALEMPGTAAMRVTIDPETGALVSGADPALDQKAATELEQMLSQSDEGLQEVHHPDGRVSLDLQGRFMSASVARVGADGKVETLCTTDQSEADTFLADQPETDANGWEVR